MPYVHLQSGTLCPTRTNTDYCQSAVKTERVRVMVGLTTPYFSHLSHLRFSNTGFSHAVFDSCIFLRIVVMVRNVKRLQNLFGIPSAKNRWGCRCTQEDTLQCACVRLVDSAGLGSSGRL